MNKSHYDSGVLAERDRIKGLIAKQIRKYESEHVTNTDLSWDTRKQLNFEILGLRLALRFCEPGQEDEEA